MNEKQNKNEIVYNKPIVKVIGLGGGGGNAVGRMIEKGYSDVEFIAANTDAQALKRSNAPYKILLGPNAAHGMGAGGNPENGEAAAIESERELRNALKGADIVFLTAGMGGGTGSGAISIAARIAREVGAVTISIVSTPFSFESGRRVANAREYLGKLASYSDTLITIPNDQLLKIAPKNLSLKEAFEVADDVLRQGVLGISQLLTGVGEINVDFSHIRNMLLNGGGSLLSIGYGKGPDKVSKALHQALNHPLLEHLPIENATGLIVNFTGNENLSFQEVMEGLTLVQSMTSNTADIIPGQIVDNTMGDEVQIIMIMTGIASTPLESMTSPAKISKLKPEIRTESVIPIEKILSESDATIPEKKEDSLQPALTYTTPIISSPNTAAKTGSTAPSGKIDISPAAEAAFDTFMSPLGLSGFEPAPVTFIVDQDVDASQDLDIPTFIRRKM